MARYKNMTIVKGVGIPWTPGFCIRLEKSRYSIFFIELLEYELNSRETRFCDLNLSTMRSMRSTGIQNKRDSDCHRRQHESSTSYIDFRFLLFTCKIPLSI